MTGIDVPYEQSQSCSLKIARLYYLHAEKRVSQGSSVGRATH